MWAALGLQHPPLSSLKWGAQSAVGGRPSVSLLNFLWWAPHPPWPTLLATSSLRPPLSSSQATSSTLSLHSAENCNRELQFPSPALSLWCSLATASHQTPAPGPSSFPPHYTKFRAAGEQQIPQEGGHCLHPCRPHSRGEGALLRYKALVRGTAAFRAGRC